MSNDLDALVRERKAHRAQCQACQPGRPCPKWRQFANVVYALDVQFEDARAGVQAGPPVHLTPKVEALIAGDIEAEAAYDYHADACAACLACRECAEAASLWDAFGESRRPGRTARRRLPTLERQAVAERERLREINADLIDMERRYREAAGRARDTEALLRLLRVEAEMSPTVGDP